MYVHPLHRLTHREALFARGGVSPARGLGVTLAPAVANPCHFLLDRSRDRSAP